MKRLLVAITLAAIVVVGGTATAAPSYEPDLSVYAPNNAVQPGTQTTFTVQVVNSAQLASSNGSVPGVAKNTRVELDEGGAPIDVQTGEVPLGAIPDGARVPASFLITVEEDADPGTYTVELDIRYEYTTPRGETLTRKVSPDVELVVRDDARFEVRSISSDVAVGETGNLSVRLENVGDEDVTSAVVNVRSGTSDLVFGTTGSATRYVGEWEGDKAKTAQFEVTATPSASTRPLPLYVSVQYETEDGLPRESKTLTTSVSPLDEQSASLSNVTAVDLAIGENGRVEGRITNTGPARLADATISLQPSGETLVPREASQPLGTLGVGESATFSYPVQVTPRAEPGSRQLSFVVTYQNRDGDTRQVRSLETIVTVADEQSVALSEVTTDDLIVGETATIEGVIRNVGPSRLHNATVSLTPSGETLLPREGSQPLGTVAVGESATFSYPVRVTAEAEPGPRQLSFVVTYENRDGDTRQVGPVETVVQVGEEQSFELSNVRSNLRVDSEGTISGTVTNVGPRSVEDAVVILQPPGPGVSVKLSEYALGTFERGESADFDFSVEVTEGTEAAPRQFSIVVQYRNEDGDERASDPLNTRVQIAEERDVFAVEGINTSVTTGSTETVSLRVINQGAETIRNVNAKLFVDDPLSAEDDEAYVPELGPGEEAIIEFDVSAGGGATARQRPLKLDFQYQEPDGDTVLSDTYQVPLSVTTSSGGGIPLPIVIGVVAVLLGLGAFAYIRYR
jgi:hypothetical protein